MATGKRILDQTAVNIANIIKDSGVISATSVFVKNVLKQHLYEIGLVLSSEEITYVVGKVGLGIIHQQAATQSTSITFKELKAVLDEIGEPIETAWSNLDETGPTSDNTEFEYAITKLEEAIALFDKVDESHFNSRLKEQLELLKTNFKIYKVASEKLDEIKSELISIFEEIKEEYDLNI